MAKLDTKYLAAGQPDGTVECDVVRTRLFKKTLTFVNHVNEGDKLSQSVNYAAALFPKGFVPRTVVANVVEANGSAAAVTVNVAKDVTDTDNATVAAVNSGSGASVFASGTVGKTLIEVSAPWVTGENDYLVLTPAAAVDAKFEVVVIGYYPNLEG